MNWTNKTLIVLKSKKPDEQASLIEIFHLILESVSALASQIQLQGDLVSKALSSFEFMKTEDMMNEMRTEDAFNKLVRVRAESPSSQEEEFDSGNELREIKPVSSKKGKMGK